MTREDRLHGREPHAQVRCHLERSRQDGVPFDAAWKQALAAVQWFSDRHRQELRVPVFGDSRVRDAFQRAYEGVPDPGAASVVALAGMWEEMQPALGPDPAGMQTRVARR